MSKIYAPIILGVAIAVFWPGVVTAQTTEAGPVASPNADVLAVAQAIPDGGGYDKLWQGSGCVREVTHGGERILPKDPDGSFCCGFTFGVFASVATDRGLLRGMSTGRVRDLQKLWYGSTNESRETQVLHAAQTYSLGRWVDLKDAKPGDFAMFWRKPRTKSAGDGSAAASGHSVVLRSLMRDKNGEIAGLSYRSSQGSTNGVGDAEERFADAGGDGGGTIDRKRTYVMRLHHDADEAERAAVAFRWAPVIYQDVDTTDKPARHGDHGRGDYITRLDFDGDWEATNNWDNLPKYPATGAVYYSVVSTKSYWFIVYGFFHARDWDELGTADLGEHENDFEGALVVVERPVAKGDGRFGKAVACVTHAHLDFYSSVPLGSALAGGKGNLDIDGTLLFENHDGMERPMLSVEPQGHGVREFPGIERFLRHAHDDYVVYRPSRHTSEEPDSAQDRNVAYVLIDILSDDGLWRRRNDPRTFVDGGRIRGLARHGRENSPKMPWLWDDHNDGDALKKEDGGHLAKDPAKLGSVYFKGWRVVPNSEKYEFNPYAKE